MMISPFPDTDNKIHTRNLYNKQIKELLRCGKKNIYYKTQKKPHIKWQIQNFKTERNSENAAKFSGNKCQNSTFDF